MGDFSTPLLHAVCGALGRKLYSIEESDEWSDRYVRLVSSNEHWMACGKYDELVPLLSEDIHWSVVFIDNSPGGEGRRKWVEHFLSKSVYVVVHDYHLENEDAIAPFISSGVMWHVTRMYYPPTLIASRVAEIPRALLQL
jgi:hypothetical protein